MCHKIVNSNQMIVTCIVLLHLCGEFSIEHNLGDLNADMHNNSLFII